MIILDTHAWLWWMAEPAKLSEAAREAIDHADRLGVATISCWEIGMLVEADRIALDREISTWIAQALGERRMQALALTSEIAVQAALLGREGFTGDPADRIIYTTARRAGRSLITRDRAMRAFDPRLTLW